MTPGKKKARPASRVGSEIIAGLKEAIAFERGNRRGAVVRHLAITARDALASPPPRFRAHDVKRLRKDLGISQVLFGAALNVSPETVRAWEQGKKEPSGSAERLLEIVRKHPVVMEGVLEPRYSMVRKPL